MRTWLPLLAIAALASGMLAPEPARADSFDLTGSYLKVGVSDSGGLIDDNFNAGIKFDRQGTGDFSSNDFLRPGTPLEFYSLGMALGSGTVYNYAGYQSGNRLAATTSYADAYLSAQTNLSYNNLLLNQVLYFPSDGNTIHFQIFGMNLGSSKLSNVVYARGLDPDPDFYATGSYDTVNTISGNKVRAFGPYTGLYVELVDQTGGGVPTVDKNADTNPFNLLVSHNPGDGDYTINLAWSIGDLDPGQTFEIDFDYVLGYSSPTAVPLPSTILLLGSGLIGLGALKGRSGRN